MYFSFQKATVLPCRTVWVADILSQAPLCDVQRQCCWNRGNKDVQRLWEYSHDWAIFQCRFSFVRRRWKGRFDAHVNHLQDRREPIAKSGKFVRHAYSRTALDCKKTKVLCFLPSWNTLLLERGLWKRERLKFDVAARSKTPKPRCYAKATNSDSCGRAVAQVKKCIPEQRTVSTEPILLKKEITIGLKPNFETWRAIFKRFFFCLKACRK